MSMATEIIGGVLIGIMIQEWLGRLILPAAVGLFACVELFVVQRHRGLPARWLSAMKAEGIPNEEIAHANRAFDEMSEKLSRGSGLIGWKIYALQFVWSTITTLPIALVTGLVRDWLA